MAGRIDLLILGAGWTSTFLIPLCVTQNISYAATRRTPTVPGEIAFTFDPDSDDPEPYAALPPARTVLITFPIRVADASARLVRLYTSTHLVEDDGLKTKFIQLGSTGVWDGSLTLQVKTGLPKPWIDRHSPLKPDNERGRAEEELLALPQDVHPTTVIDLAGLWGGPRDPRHWVQRVAPTKEALRKKGSLHMIHGDDVARAVLAVHHAFDQAAGQRWLLTDGRVYDWWDLASAWGNSMSAPGPSRKARQAREHAKTAAGTAQALKLAEGLATPQEPADGTRDMQANGEEAEKDENAHKDEDEKERGPHPRWVRELMMEEGVRALPRTPEMLDRALDSREFWTTFGISPLRARLEPE